MLPLVLIPLNQESDVTTVKVPKPPVAPKAYEMPAAELDSGPPTQSRLNAWSILLGNYASQSDASVVRQQLAELKLPSYILQNDKTFQVYAGPIATEAEAKKISENLNQTLNVESTTTKFYALEDNAQ